MHSSPFDRVLEPEAMDTPQEAADYDAMDHSVVNRLFVDHLLAVTEAGGDILDLGTGTARIPIELCERAAHCRVMAVDLAISMLELARYNVEVAGLRDRIMLDHVDGKSLPYPDGRFQTVISNSIIHHIPQPESVVREAARVTAPGGCLFFRDLMRPASQADLDALVREYAGDEAPAAQKMFADSLRAALTVDEFRDLVENAGFPRETVQQTSDRHWTWFAQKPA